MHTAFVVLLITSTALSACIFEDRDPENCGYGNSIIAVEYNNTLSREKVPQSVLLVCKNQNTNGVYRRKTTQIVSDGNITVNPKDYLDGKIPYGPIKQK
jgi:hypothetical protein